MNWIDRTYVGREQLWKVFWFGFIAPLLPLTVAFGIFKETATRLPSWVSFAFFVTVFLYQAWLTIATWRCAPNVKYRVFFYVGRLFAIFQGLMLLAAALQFLRGTF